MQRKPLSAATLRRGLRPGFVGLGVLAVVLAAWALSPDNARDALRERAFDRLLPLLPRQTAGGPGVVIVDIDRATLARFGPWPWPRSRMAELVAAAPTATPPRWRSTSCSPAAIDFRRMAMRRWHTPCRRCQPCSGLSWRLRIPVRSCPQRRSCRAAPSRCRVSGGQTASSARSAALANAAQGFGALVAAADPDGPIRRVPLLVVAGNVVRPGLAVETVRLAQEASALLIDPRGELIVGNLALPLGRDATLRLWGPTAAATISATRLIEEPAARAALAGRIVLIGSSAPEVGGLRVTPASPATPSVQIQAAAIEAILRGQVLSRPVWAEFTELAGAASLGLLCLLFAARLRPATAAVLALLVCLAWTAAAAAAVPGLAVLLDPAGPPLVAIVTFAMATLVRFVRDEWRARLLRLSFEQHLAPEVVRRIAADPSALRLRGEMREITALFTDIEGFTGMTERAEPADLVALLDAYFDVATRIVTDHGGMIDKIVGDAIHAIFNAPFELADHPRHAVAAGLALLQATDDVRQSPLGQRLQLGRTRIGIETGPAIVGDVGGSRKLDYTAHGNAINAAARLEAANKDLGSAICIGPGTAARLDPTTVRQIGTLTLRGQSGEISVYTPVSLAGPVST